MTNFDTMEKELREKRGVISSLDFAREVVAIATVAIDAMTNTRNKELATAIAAMKIKEAVSKLFPEELAEEPDAEKPELSALEELLFEKAHLATVRCKEVCSDIRDIRYGRLLESDELIKDADLQEKYNFWKAVNGYE